MIELDLIWAILIGLLFPLIGYQLKLSLFPQHRGTILEFLQPNLDLRCSTGCGTGIKIKVKLDNGQIVEAWISPCTICLEKLKPGSKVAINKLGQRYIALGLFRGWSA